MSASQAELAGEALERAIGYYGKPFPQTHPDRLATVARLHGVASADPAHCRVLELGCGDGANLLPMALSFPNSEFVGLDLNAPRVEAGAAWAKQLGLANVRLEARDIAEVGAEYGKFDYIVAHGVYCWVPAVVRERLLALCHELLEPNGVAFVSFNALPGWHFLQPLRELAHLTREHSADLSPEQLLKRVRGLAALLAAEQAPATDAQAAHLSQLYRRLETTSDYLLAFEYLGELSEPVALAHFAKDVARHGLRYLADANLFESSWNRLTPRVRGVLSKLTDDAVAREGFADHYTARLFRRALIIQGTTLASVPSRNTVRELHVLTDPKPEVAGLWDVVDDKPVGVSMLHGTKLTVSNRVVKAALQILGRRWPSSASFDELVSMTTVKVGGVSPSQIGEVLEAAVWDMYMSGAVELRTSKPDCVTEPTERPLTSAFSRLQLGFGDVVSNQHHDYTRLIDPFSRELFLLLDGSRTLEELTKALLARAQRGELAPLPETVSEPQLAVETQARLALWARHALLVG